MQKKIVLGAIALTCLAGAPAFAHELANSQKLQIKVNVAGEAGAWCKPEVALSIERPSWDNAEPLNALLPKLPFILGQECPNAKVSWKAVDAAGKVFATGAGTASNLGLANLTSQQPAVAQAAPATPLAPSTVTAPAPVPAPVAAVAPVPVAEPAAPVVAAAPVAAAPSEAPPAPVAPAVVEPVSQPAVLAQPSSDYGRSLLLANENLREWSDASGCKWLTNTSAIGDELPAFYIDTVPAATCANGYAQGSYDRVNIGIRDTYRKQTWGKVFVHPSGLMFYSELGQAMKNQAVSFVSPDGTQALFEMGQIPDRGMTVYLAFERGDTRTWAPYSSGPYYVITTASDSFAMNPSDYTAAVKDIYALLKRTYPRDLPTSNLFIAKTLAALYPPRGERGDTTLQYVRNQLSERNGSLFFDPKSGNNYSIRRAEIAKAQFQRMQEQLAYEHGRVLDRYRELQEQIAKTPGGEIEVLAKLTNVRATLGSPIALMNPNGSHYASLMVVHVDGKSGDYYEADYPGKSRLLSDVDLEDGWYVLKTANMTPFTELKDGHAVPTYRVYAPEAPQACAEAKCADRISIKAVLAHEFEKSGIDFSQWSPEASQQFIDALKQTVSQVQ